jgi:hypothetical protein
MNCGRSAADVITFYCPFCPHAVFASDKDPDSGMSIMLGHIRWRHDDQDQTPAVLWPKIRTEES